MTSGFAEACGWAGPVLAVATIVAMWAVVLVGTSVLFKTPGR